MVKWHETHYNIVKVYPEYKTKFIINTRGKKIIRYDLNIINVFTLSE